ncbi:GrdX family protein [Vagococcus elongatus]|uniref:GrdX protein n=1 Tax=Vagococcus elongatus TaxID=180344 RepID=A0A430B625_9ENTE|nr:GrdX family protein [Vagococcus elongatus]RSU15748.1 hypothetical protein CBF29_01365 [Vagococcus elongatus]
MILLTNNPKVSEEMKAVNNVKIYYYQDVDYGGILEHAQQLIVNEKLILLSHPLSGSIKPNETYYKTIFFSEKSNQFIDIESLEYIESALLVYEKFMKNQMRPNWTEKILADFAFVDLYLTKSTLQRMGTTYVNHSG